MTFCPECGLPRGEDQVGTACPVCAAAPAVRSTARPAEVPSPDPTAGLPSDAGELLRHAAAAAGFPRWLPWVAVFLLGTAAGAVGSFGWRAASSPAEVAGRERPAPADQAPGRLSQVPPPRTGVEPARAEVAPMPHEPAPPERAVAPAPRAATGTPRPPRVFTIDLDDPDLYFVPSSDLRKARWVILRGKVKSLRVFALDDGQVFDASGLEVGSVHVSGRIDGRSVLKVNAPGGIVSFADAVSGGASVEVTAPGGEVQFSRETRPGRPGSQIDGGSAVTITAQRVNLRGDVTGAGTRVTVNLTGGGWLWAESVLEGAAVEYRTADGRGKPGASAGVVAPTAAFKQIE